jgi:hypothetical protein
MYIRTKRRREFGESHCSYAVLHLGPFCMRKHLSLYGALILSIVGCSSNHNVMSANSWSISMGSGGGITGGTSGYSIEGTGHVTHWSQATPSATKESTGESTIEASDAGLFRRYLERIRFDTISSSTPSNRNLFVELDSAGSVHRVNWGVGVHSTSSGITDLQRFYDFVLSYLAAQKG